MNLLILVTCALFFQFGKSARILGIVPTPSYSHQVAFHPLWIELSKYHELVVLTTNPIKDNSLTNLTEIDLHFTYNIFSLPGIKEKILESANNPLQFIIEFTKAVEHLYNDVLSYVDVQNLLQNENEHFDVVLTEALYPAMLAFGERFNCPTIGILSLDASFILHRLMGNPTHPLIYPENVLPFYGDLTFKERLISTIYQLFIDYFRGTSVFARDQRILDKYFSNVTDKNQNQLESQMSMLFVNSNPIINGNRAYAPNTISFGGTVQMRKRKGLPHDIEEFLNKATEGVIYFSLGSNVKSRDLPDVKKNVLLETFSELPYKVLWKFEADQLEGKPDNVKIVKWLPQQDVLDHPNIKLFITQGGIQSMEEAMFSHVPMIGIPFFGDQKSNVRRMVFRQMGLEVDLQTLTKEIFKEAIYEVINNNKYRESVIKSVELMTDQPMTGLEKVVWWTDYVIRHKGATHFANPAQKYPFYQQYLLDVYGFLILVGLLALTLKFIILRFIFRLIKRILIRVKVKND